MKHYRVWFIRFAFTLTLLEVFTVFFNYVLDPLWCFGTVNYFNSTAVIIDQRQQKTNRLAFESAIYDALLIGSSRGEPIPSDAFIGEHVFNYSVPAIYPDEYLPYLRYAREKRVPHLRRIYLGLDFFGSNRNHVMSNPQPENYFTQVDTSSYRLNALLSPGSLRAWIKRRFEQDYYYRYDRSRAILIPRKMKAGEVERFTHKRLAIFREMFYLNAKYAYNTELPSLYRSILAEFPSTEIVPYTSPVSLQLLKTLAEEGRYPDYERWVRDIVGAFGGVYHFMDANSVTMQSDNFYDADHLYPQAAELIARRLSGTGTTPPADFGMYISENNLEACLAELRARHSKLLGSLERL